jgi:hypothetical protein
MRWPSSASFPYNAGYVARERLPLRHYPRRDPVQLQRRYLLRSAMMADSQNRADWGSGAVTHWYEMDWRRDVVPDDLPGLLRWQPGEPLPQTDSTSHLASMPKRMAQRLIHALALPFLDPRRPGWQEGTYPARIPPRVVAELERQLAVPA